jgi:zinc transport system ATP-binding protein
MSDLPGRGSVMPPASGPAPLIDARGIVVEAGGHRILGGVDLAVRPGEIVTVVGPNGSGKTTLLRVLVGALRPAAGTVHRRPDLRIGYVPQRLSIDRTLPMTVGRFLALAGGPRGAAVQALAESGIEGLESRQMAALSGGQFQRVLLAHALLRRPGLLVLDEPTQGLDQAGSAAFYALVAELRRRRGIAVLMVSHDLHVVMRATDRVICLNGHVCCEGTPAAVTADPAWLALFGPAAGQVLALYAHSHDHSHDADCDHRPAALEQAP